MTQPNLIRRVPMFQTNLQAPSSGEHGDGGGRFLRHINNYMPNICHNPERILILLMTRKEVWGKNKQRKIIINYSCNFLKNFFFNTGSVKHNGMKTNEPTNLGLHEGCTQSSHC
jgi:hypothetical protein